MSGALIYTNHNKLNQQKKQSSGAIEAPDSLGAGSSWSHYLFYNPALILKLPAQDNPFS